MKAGVHILALLLAAAVTPAHAESHALILTISAYKGGVTPLEGVKYDVESARAIARSMGVKNQNIRHYKDDELTLAGMRRAFDDFYARVADNDQVFIYYSGHGSRQRVSRTDTRCAVALVTVNGEGFPDTEIDAQLKRLAQKTQKMVVFLDACHSGGVKTRSATPTSPGLTPRFHVRAGAEACEVPVNVVTRSLASQTRSIGQGINNYVYIAAARENEVSFDNPAKGGIATQAWRECITGAARDSDGSGGLSAAEISQCAQERINGMLKGAKGILPHHVSVFGNANSVLAFPERSSPAPAAAAAPAPVVATAPAPVAPPAPAPAAPAAGAPAAAASAQPALPAAYHTLVDMYNNRDDRRTVTLRGTLPKFKIGADNIGFVLNSSHPGYVYLLMVGSDGKTFDMLFPNRLDASNQMLRGETMRLPRPSWEIKAGGPPGKNYLLAIVADSPRDFAKAGMRPAGPFSMAPANAESSKDMQMAGATSSTASAQECQTPPEKRTLQIAQRCSNAYGAAMMVLEESQ